MSLSIALAVDTVTVLLCLAALIKKPGFRHSHPAVAYLVFHVIVISVRAWGIKNGSPTALQVTSQEAVRALLISDVLLVSLTWGWLSVPHVRRSGIAGARPHQLDGRIVAGVSAVAIPIGLYYMVRFTSLGGGVSTDTITTNYQTLAVTWPGLMLVALVYRFGFRWFYTLPLASYLAIMAVQGESRSRLILPAILIAQIYLDRRQAKWPGIPMVAALVGLAFLFYPLDAIGEAAQDGELSPSRLTQIVRESAASSIRGDNDEQHIFDQYSAAVALSEEREPLLGRHFVDLLALPIPRPLWPDKPATNEHIIELSTPSRPLSTIGAVMTLPGELWVDFRWLGIIGGGLFLGRIGGLAFRRAYESGFGTVFHFLYLLCVSLLIQIYRDGLSTLPIFFLVSSLPLVIVASLSVLWKLPDAGRPGSARASLVQHRGDS